MYFFLSKLTVCILLLHDQLIDYNRQGLDGSRVQIVPSDGSRGEGKGESLVQGLQCSLPSYDLPSATLPNVPLPRRLSAWSGSSLRWKTIAAVAMTWSMSLTGRM